MERRYNRLRVVLAEREITSGKLAELVGVHRTSVSAWVTNKAQPSVVMLYRIAEALGVGVCDLLVDSASVPSGEG